MFRTNPIQPGLDFLESVSLNFPRVAIAPSTELRDTLNGYRLDLNGTLHCNKTTLKTDAKSPPPADSQVLSGAPSYFETCGRISTLGKVSGSFGLNDGTNAASGQFPNLSNLTLHLSNHEGSVQLYLLPSATNQYTFRISRGAGSYSAVRGSGLITIISRRGSNEYLLRLESPRS
jgi:hypothetical protein